MQCYHVACRPAFSLAADETADSSSSSSSNSSTGGALQPSLPAGTDHLEAHFAETGHCLGIDCEKLRIYCRLCRDYVYSVDCDDAIAEGREKIGGATAATGSATVSAVAGLSGLDRYASDMHR